MKKIIIIFLFLIGLLLLIYGYFIEPQQLGITKYTLKDKSLKNIKIVFTTI